MKMDLQNILALVGLLGAATRTASAQGAGVDISGYQNTIKAILDSSAGGGTTPTLNVVLEHSDDDGGSDPYTAIPGAAFAEVTDAAASLQSIGLDTRLAKKFIRANATIAGGGGETFTFAVNLVAHDQYKG